MDPDDTFPPPCEQHGIHKCRVECKHSDAAACTALAYAYHDGLGPLDRDRERAHAFALEACTLDYGRACTYAAFDLLNTVAAEAIALNEKACGLGYGPGCYRAGLGAGQRDAPTRDYSDAVRLFRRGCELDWASACLIAAELHETGLAEVPEGPELRRRGCELNANLCTESEASELLAMAIQSTPDPPMDELAQADYPERDVRVVAKFCVRAVGELSAVELASSSGNDEIDGIVLETVQKWKFYSLTDDPDLELGCSTMAWEIHARSGAPH